MLTLAMMLGGWLRDAAPARKTERDEKFEG